MTDAADPEEALTRLLAAGERYEEATAVLDEARADAIAAVVAALEAGASPTAVTRDSPFTDAYVRKIARDHDIAPARPGIKPGMRGAKKAPAKPAPRMKP